MFSLFSSIFFLACFTNRTSSEGINNEVQHHESRRLRALQPTEPTSNWKVITSDNFEVGWGNFAPNGNASDVQRCVKPASCASGTDVPTHSGIGAILIRDNSGSSSSFSHRSSHDVSQYTMIRVHFWYHVRSLENGEKFSLDYSSNGGSSWTAVKQWIVKAGINNDILINQMNEAFVILHSTKFNFSTEARIRFRCDASDDDNNVFIDDVQVAGSRQVPDLDVVIVGAGWAGIAAAEYFLSKGVTFQLLEARTYVGGRSRTERIGPANVSVDLGSEWILEPKNNEIQRVLDQTNLSSGVTSCDYDLWDQYDQLSGKLNATYKNSLLEKLWTGKKDGFIDYESIQRRDLTSVQDKTYQQVFESYVQNKGISNSSFEYRYLQMLLNSEVVTENAASIDEVSLKYGEYMTIFGAVPMTYLGGSFGVLAQTFASDILSITDRIRLTSIQYNKDIPTVTYTHAPTNSTYTLTARAVLVTVPLGVLKNNDITFQPVLPKWKKNTINRFGFGNLNKCILYWNDTIPLPWNLNAEWLSLTPDTTDRAFQNWTFFFNAYPVNGNHKVLVAYIGGKDADAIESLPDDKMKDGMMESLTAMFGDGNVPPPTAFIVSRWRQDPFARGAYSFVKAYLNFEQDVEALGAPLENVVWFAGEATDVLWWATTTGAYRSGTRFAKDIYLAIRNV